MFSYVTDPNIRASMFMILGFVYDGMFLGPPFFMFVVNKVLRKEMRKLLFCFQEARHKSIIYFIKNQTLTLMRSENTNV